MSRQLNFSACGAFLALSGLSLLIAQDIRVVDNSTDPVIPNYGGRVSWGANNLLAWDSPSAITGYYDVYTSNPDGSNAVCLTCGAATIPAFNKGDPEWHPASQYLAIAVQWQNVSPASPLFAVYTPGGGAGSDLYIMDAAGKNYWPITTTNPKSTVPGDHAAGILHPRFSHDGTKLLWTQRYETNCPSGARVSCWNLDIADFAVVNGVPRVTNIQSLPPCASDKLVFCETGGFGVDDSIVFFPARWTVRS